MYIYLTLCFVVLFSGIQATYYTEYDMDSSCGSTISFYDAVKLKFRSSNFYLTKQCKVTFKALDLYSSDLMLGVKAVSMDVPCSQGSVLLHQMYSGFDRTLCGYSSSVTYKSSGDKFSVEVKNIDDFISTATFTLIVTKLNDGFCSSSQWECDNTYCIDDSLKCDGYDNCGDDSDEKCFWTTGSISGVVIGVICFFVFVAIILGVYRRRYYTTGYVHQPAMASISTVSLPTIAHQSHCHQNVQHCY